MVKFFRSIAKSFSDINKKYKNPSIKPTKAVVVSLVILRLYLLGMVGLLVYSFITALGAKH